MSTLILIVIVRFYCTRWRFYRFALGSFDREKKEKSAQIVDDGNWQQVFLQRLDFSVGEEDTFTFSSYRKTDVHAFLTMPRDFKLVQAVTQVSAVDLDSTCLCFSIYKLICQLL